MFSIFKVDMKIRNANWGIRSSKISVFMLNNLIGLLSGTIIFHGVIWMLEFCGVTIVLGHDVMIVSVVIFNVLIGFVFSIIGVVLIPWKSLEW